MMISSPEPNSSLAALLRDHEAQRIQGDTFDLREFDTGQVLLRGLSVLGNPSEEADRFPDPPAATVDSWHLHLHKDGTAHVRGDGGAHRFMDSKRDQLPRETAELVDRLSSEMRSGPEAPAHVREIMPGYVTTRAGHERRKFLEYMPLEDLWALQAIPGINKGAVPEIIREVQEERRKTGGLPTFDMTRGREWANREGLLLTSKEIRKPYDGFVAFVTGDSPEDASSQKYRQLRIQFFNPSMLYESPPHHAANGAEGKQWLPKLRQRFFELTIQACGSDTRSEIISSDCFSHPELREKDSVWKTHRGKSFYVKVPEPVMVELSGAVDLPIDHSDCGSGLGSRSTTTRNFIPTRDLTLMTQELASRFRRSVDFLNDSVGWQPFTSPADIGAVLSQGHGGAVVTRSQKLGDQFQVDLKAVPDDLRAETKLLALLGGRTGDDLKSIVFDLRLEPKGARFMYFHSLKL